MIEGIRVTMAGALADGSQLAKKGAICGAITGGSIMSCGSYLLSIDKEHASLATPYNVTVLVALGVAGGAAVGGVAFFVAGAAKSIFDSVRLRHPQELAEIYNDQTKLKAEIDDCLEILNLTPAQKTFFEKQVEQNVRIRLDQLRIQSNGDDPMPIQVRNTQVLARLECLKTVVKWLETLE